MAERRFANYSSIVTVQMWSDAWQTEKLNAQHWLRLSGGVATLEQSERMAAHLTWTHWAAVVRIAEALLAQGELSGVGIDALLRNPSGSLHCDCTLSTINKLIL
jgi:hypothetical protein